MATETEKNIVAFIRQWRHDPKAPLHRGSNAVRYFKTLADPMAYVKWSLDFEEHFSVIVDEGAWSRKCLKIADLAVMVDEEHRVHHIAVRRDSGKKHAPAASAQTVQYNSAVQ